MRFNLNLILSLTTTERPSTSVVQNFYIILDNYIFQWSNSGAVVKWRHDTEEGASLIPAKASFKYSHLCRRSSTFWISIVSSKIFDVGSVFIAEKFDQCKILSKRFDIYCQIIYRDVENFFQHQAELVLRHPMWVSYYFIKFFDSV
jgi:hypothetical protein